VGSKIIYRLTNDAQELTHNKFEFKPDANKIREGGVGNPAESCQQQKN
jgi:hypothetical protein